jgi:hypothetical protein
MHILPIGLLFVCGLASASAQPPLKPAEEPLPPGVRLTLTDGKLFLPDGFKAEPEGIDLTLHLHGAASAMEKNFARAKAKGVLVTVVLPGLSKVYTEKFRDPAVFSRILKEIGQELERRGLTKEARFRRITVTSFSAGFGGVRELLKVPETFARIDALVMADSIYAGFVGEAAKRRVDPANMEGFLKFAREAAEGRKRFILSHSQLHTPDYASTVETADYLLAQIGGTRETLKEEWPGEMTLLSRFRRKGLEIYGFAGDTGPDHMKHLHRLSAFLERANAQE